MKDSENLIKEIEPAGSNLCFLGSNYALVLGNSTRVVLVVSFRFVLQAVTTVVKEVPENKVYRTNKFNNQEWTTF